MRNMHEDEYSPFPQAQDLKLICIWNNQIIGACLWKMMIALTLKSSPQQPTKKKQNTHKLITSFNIVSSHLSSGNSINAFFCKSVTFTEQVGCDSSHFLSWEYQTPLLGKFLIHWFYPNSYYLWNYNTFCTVSHEQLKYQTWNTMKSQENQELTPPPMNVLTSFL